MHTLTNTTKEEMSHMNENCPYIRILGMSKNGKDYTPLKTPLKYPLVNYFKK
ncbi:nucleotidyltransferase family protein [Anaerobacillus sp. HL2]|nr:nucleotidyltransferase family protein [Anaerobacillus sp. HL2]